MKFKGTKGKWIIYVSDDYGGDYSIKSENGKITLFEHEANALLISKAPEMLEMLKELINLHELGHEIGQYDKAKQLIKEAIKIQ